MIQPTIQTLHYIEQLYSNNSLNKSGYTSITSPFAGGDVIDDDVARFLRLLLMIKRPQHILEIGTSIGYSTVSMAQIIKPYGGKITTIELDEEIAGTAKENFVRYGVSENIELMIGYAEEIVPALRHKFDCIFMDVGDKSLYKELANGCVEKLRTGGIFVAEDSLYGSFANDKSISFSRIAKTLNEFNKVIANHPDLGSTLLPIGDGVTLAVKK